MKHALAQINATDLNAPAILKSVDIFTAIRWIMKVWEEVTPQIASKKKQKTTEAIESRKIHLQNEAHATSLDELIQQIDPETTTDEYIAADDDLSTCLTFEDTTIWRKELRSIVREEISSWAKHAHVAEECEYDEDEDDADTEKVLTLPMKWHSMSPMIYSSSLVGNTV